MPKMRETIDIKALRRFFDSLPPDRKKRVLCALKGATPETRRLLTGSP